MEQDVGAVHSECAEEQRRRHSRRPVDTRVFCYVAGSRLDTRGRDIGGGGMFVSMDDPGLVPHGALVGLAFGGGAEPTTFLFGRVVRHQNAPRPGLGLRWESASTTGSPEHLALFIVRLLGVVPSGIETAAGPDGRPGRAIYRFPGAPDARPDASPVATADARPAVATTGRVAIRAVARTAGLVLHGRIVDIEPGRLRLLTMASPDRDLVQVSFELASPAGPVPVTCHCVVSAVAREPSGATRIELAIQRVNEGDHPGVLQRYARWLRGNAPAPPQGGVRPQSSRPLPSPPTRV